MRTTQSVGTNCTAIAIADSKSPAPFSTVLAFLAAYAWSTIGAHSQHLRRLLLALTAIVAVLLNTTYLILKRLRGKAVVALLYLLFNEENTFHIWTHICFLLER